jgi:transposase
MANRLKVGWVYAIETLLKQGWSHRRIAQTLEIDRSTVARYARKARAPAKPAKAPPGSGGVVEGDPAALLDSKPAGAPPGSDGPGAGDSAALTDSKPAEALIGSWTHGVQGGPCTPPGIQGGSADTHRSAESSDVTSQPTAPVQPSRCEPFRAIILAKLEHGLSAQRIYQDLVQAHGFEAKYHSVRRFVQRLNGARPLPFRRMECAAGDEAQVDFGKGAPILQPNGKRKRPHLFRIVLSHSRKGYSEVVWRQDTETFLRALENAFHHFGGVPKTLVVDNLKAAVLQADWYDPDLNPKIRAFAEHYGSTILPCKPRMPRHKGKIENQIGYAQDNALKGLEFAGLEDQNRHLLEWETSVADTRIHGTTRKQVGKVFEEIERATLLPLPLERFPCFHEAQRVVSRDAHVEVDKAFYSVPPEHLGRTVWVRWDARMVRIFDQRFQQLAVHAKSEPGRFRTQPEHIAPEKISKVEKSTTWLLNQASYIGSHAQRWCESMLQHRGIEGVRVLQGLISLESRHPSANIDQACEIAQTHGAYRLRAIRELIKRKAPVQEQFEFIDRHPIIRNLSDYGNFVRASLTRTAWAPSGSSIVNANESSMGNGFTALVPIPKG